LLNVFNEFDHNEDGSIDLSEFSLEGKNAAEIARLKGTLRAAGITMNQAAELFQALDADHSGSLNKEEFVRGFMRIKEPPQSKHILKVECQLESMLKKIGPMESDLGRVVHATTPWKMSSLAKKHLVEDSDRLMFDLLNGGDGNRRSYQNHDRPQKMRSWGQQAASSPNLCSGSVAPCPTPAEGNLQPQNQPDQSSKCFKRHPFSPNDSGAYPHLLQKQPAVASGSSIELLSNSTSPQKLRRCRIQQDPASPISPLSPDFSLGILPEKRPHVQMVAPVPEDVRASSTDDSMRRRSRSEGAQDESMLLVTSITSCESQILRRHSAPESHVPPR